MEENGTAKRRERAIAAFLFVLTIVLVLFSSQPVHYVGPSDAASYLAVARSVPELTLYDRRPYVLHPPVFPLAIRAAAVFVRDLVRGGLVLGILANAALVVVAFRIGLLLSGDLSAAFLGALVLASSRVVTYTSQGIFREPLQVLLVHGALLAAVTGARREGRASLARLGLAAVLAVAASLTWDPIVFLSPFLAGTGFVVKRRRALVAIALVSAVAWLCWASFRKNALETRGVDGTYPAGIDGMVEETAHVSGAAFLNPNFLPETKQHNAYFWPRKRTFGHLELILGPAILAHDVLYADSFQPLAFRIGSRVLLTFAGIGLLAFLVRAGTKDGRRRLALLLVFAAPTFFLGSPGLLGNTSRYAMNLVPPVAILAGIGAVELVRVFRKRKDEEPAFDRPERLELGLAVVGIALVVATFLARPFFTLARPDLFLGRSVAEVVRKIAPGARVAAWVDWPPALAWLLPDERVLALPLDASRLDRFFRDYDPDLVVVPLGGPLYKREDATDDEWARATGIRVLEEISRRSQGPEASLVNLGFAVEAETSDASRVHAFVVLARKRPGRMPEPFSFHMPPGEALAAALAVEDGDMEHAGPGDMAVLANGIASVTSSGDPGASRLERALERRLKH